MTPQMKSVLLTAYNKSKNENISLIKMLQIIDNTHPLEVEISYKYQTSIQSIISTYLLQSISDITEIKINGYKKHTC